VTGLHMPPLIVENTLQQELLQNILPTNKKWLGTLMFY